jgi:hypothetical protein
MLSVFLVAMVALILVVAASQSWAEEIPFSKVRIFIEFNATDNDVGVQVLLDGEPWKSLKIKGPNGSQLLSINTDGSLKKQGLTELFFESSEPSLAEVPLAEFLKRFPAGRYEFEGITVEGDELEGEAKLTHVIPAGPVIVSPQDECDSKDCVIEWQKVTQKIPGSGQGTLKIVAYQVIAARVDNDNLGAAPRTFDIKLKATGAATQKVTIPPEFLESGKEYEFEVLAIEAGGNQTISSSSFVAQ